MLCSSPCGTSHAFRRRRFRGEATDKERFDIENEARKTLVQLVSGLAIVVTIALTLYQYDEWCAADRNLELTARSQTSQRFAQALDLLGESDSGKEETGTSGRWNLRVDADGTQRR